MLHHALNTRPQPVATWPHAAALGLALTAGCGRAALLGTFNHRYLTDPPTVDDPTIGRSRRHVIPAPLHIRVGEDGQGMMGYIGRTAHRALFAAYPPFDFNVVFNVADSDLWTGVSDYANPDSIWYNIFFGYYDIRVSTRLWRRPFGYANATPTSPLVREDLVRIGKADWNYFSNHAYGVPLRAVRRADAVDMARVAFTLRGRSVIGRRAWDVVDMDGVSVVSPGRSTLDGGDFAPLPDPTDGVWRFCFGRYPAVPSIAESFPVVTMRATLFASFREEQGEEGREWVTTIYGAVVRREYPDAAANERFLRLQVESIRTLIAREGDLGFEPQ